MIYVFLIIQLIYAAAVFFAYRKGIKDGYSIYKGEAVKDTVERKIPPKPPDTDEIIRSNIENYNGGGEGQTDYGEI